MKRKPIVIFILAALTGCGMATGQSQDDQAREMLDWMQRNPPVSEATWRGVSKLECRPHLLDVCDTRSCKSKQFSEGGGRAPVLLKWFPAEKKFQRCGPDGGSCDTYSPAVSY